MIDALKQQWRQLKQDEPGKRFQKLHERRQKAGKRNVSGVAIRIAAVLLVVIGVALMILPGPGIPFVIVGIGLLASESRAVASLADRSEVQLRVLVARLRGDRSGP